MNSPKKAKFIITCEHGGNEVPDELLKYFSKSGDILNTHRGYDIGALELARKISAGLDSPFFYSETTRLVADLNRSIFSKNLFSEFTSVLNKEEKDHILQKYYFPYRETVESEIAKLAEDHRVIHIAVHSFTPVMNDQIRNADIGLLYDPKRKPEKTFCSLWKQKLDKETPSFRTRMNYPYRGISDCLPLKLKRILPPDKYTGIELEINNKIFENPILSQMLHETLLKTLLDIKEQQQNF